VDPPHWVQAGIRRSSGYSWPRYPTARKGELDDLLIAVGAKRDGKAFAILFDHLQPRVHAQLVRLGLAPAAAEDLTQDVMETIWRKAHLYDPRRSAAVTWVFQVARNRRIDLRRRSRECSFALESFLAIPDPAAGSDDCLDASQLQQCVRIALRALPHEQFTAGATGVLRRSLAQRHRAAAQLAAWNREVAAAARLHAPAARVDRCRPDQRVRFGLKSPSGAGPFSRRAAYFQSPRIPCLWAHPFSPQ
jgi:RNA polymerase sigma factor (sigma-70 family)